MTIPLYFVCASFSWDCPCCGLENRYDIQSTHEMTKLIKTQCQRCFLEFKTKVRLGLGDYDREDPIRIYRNAVRAKGYRMKRKEYGVKYMEELRYKKRRKK